MWLLRIFDKETSKSVDTDSRNLSFIGHRGNTEYSPENTLHAFRTAAKKNIKCVEFDVMLTKDKQAIIFHDETLDRTTKTDGYVGDCTLEYIKTLNAGNGEQIPTLLETIQVLIEENLDANIEIKPCGDTAIETAEIVLALVKQYWPAKKNLPIISSFDPQCIAYAFEHYPEYPRALLQDKWDENCCFLAKQYQCTSINLDQKHITREQVEANTKAGFTTNVYTVNTIERAHIMKEWGVTAIFSDKPSLLALLQKEALESRNELLNSQSSCIIT